MDRLRDIQETKYFKNVFGFLLGVLLTLGLYYGILTDLEMNRAINRVLFISLLCIITTACVFSEKAQCMGVISVTSMFSRVGRRYLQALLVAFLLAGPAQNIIDNSREAVRTFGCSVELTHNLSREYAHLVTAPFHHAVLGLAEEDPQTVEAALSQIHDQVTSIKEELLLRGEAKRNQNEELRSGAEEVDQGETSRASEIDTKYQPTPNEKRGEAIERKYLKSLETECLGILGKSTKRCNEAFDGAFDKCNEKLPVVVNYLICWPMKLDFVCNIITHMAGEKACDPHGKIDAGFGDSYEALDKTDTVLEDKLGNASFQYRVIKPNVSVEVVNAATEMRSAMAEVKVKLDLVHMVMLIMRRLLLLIWLPTLSSSADYVKRYLTQPGHDNRYIGVAWYLLEEKRRTAGRKPLLTPLKGKEKARLVQLRSCGRSGPERDTSKLKSLSYVAMLSCFAIFVVGLNYLMESALTLVAKHGAAKMLLTGRHATHVIVRGSGFAARLVRRMLSGFEDDAKIHADFGTFACLPKVQSLSPWFLIKIFASLLSLLILVYVEHLPARLPAVVSSYFFPKREKQRVIFLYNTILRGRWVWRQRAIEQLANRVIELQQEERLNAMSTTLMSPCLQRVLTYLHRLIPSRWFQRPHTCALCGTHVEEGPEHDLTLRVLEEKSERRVYPPTCTCWPQGMHLCEPCWNDLGKACPLCSLQAQGRE